MKNGNFVGKFTRRMTTEEMEQFVSILESAFYDAKIKIKDLENVCRDLTIQVLNLTPIEEGGEK